MTRHLSEIREARQAGSWVYAGDHILGGTHVGFAAAETPAMFFLQALGAKPQVGEHTTMKNEFKLDVNEIESGFLVTVPGIAGLRMWHQDRKIIARFLPARAKRILKNNDKVDVEVWLKMPRGVRVDEAISHPATRLVAEGLS